MEKEIELTNYEEGRKKKQLSEKSEEAEQEA